MPYSMKPLGCDPAKIKGMSERLILSHYDNNYGGAVKRLNLIEEQIAELDFATVPGFLINGLKREQLVDDQRLDDERMLPNEAREEPGPIDQRTEQIEVGIRRDHDIQPPTGFKTLASLVEQRRDVAIGWTGVPTAVGEIARFARVLGRARQDHIE